VVSVWTWKNFPVPKFCKNHLRGYTPLGQIYSTNYEFWQLCQKKVHMLKATKVTFNVMVWTLESGDPPMPNFVKIA